MPAGLLRCCDFKIAPKASALARLIAGVSPGEVVSAHFGKHRYLKIGPSAWAGWLKQLCPWKTLGPLWGPTCLSTAANGIQKPGLISEDPFRDYRWVFWNSSSFRRPFFQNRRTSRFNCPCLPVNFSAQTTRPT
jgi:hypothetical protein